MAGDKNTIGVTRGNQEVLDFISEKKLFNDQMEAAKFALSYAINRGAEPTELKGTDTKWNVGSFDRAGKLRMLLPILFPSVDAPYRATESLVNSGLEMLGEHLAENHDFDFIELLEEFHMHAEESGSEA